MNLKLFLITHDNNQGMALPFALGIGVLMILAGTMMLLRSQTDQTHVKAQHSTLEAINAAEVGATRIFTLINQNRYLAMYPDCISRDGSGNCNDSGTELSQKSWANANNFPEITVCEAEEGEILENLSLSLKQNWQAIDPNDPQKGEFRLVSYEYDNPGNVPGTGQLTVEGRVNKKKDLLLASASTITVEIPVSAGVMEENTMSGVRLDNEMGKCNLSKTVIKLGFAGKNKEDGRLTTTSGEIVFHKPGETSLSKSINRQSP